MISRTIDVAGVVLRFHGDQSAADLLDGRYGAFAISAPTGHVDAEIELELRAPRARAPAVPAARDSVPATRHAVPAAPHDDGFAVTERDGRAVFDGGGLRAEVNADAAWARIRAPRAERAVDAVVRYVLASHLLARGGLLVHASAVRIGDRAWVFAGPSGCGKTTIGTRLAGELLCDEAVAVMPGGAGPVAWATPYWHARPGHAPIAGLVFPERPGRATDAPEWRAVSAGQALARLMREIGPLLPSAAPRILRAAAPLVSATSCARVTMPTIENIHDWLQPRLAATPPVPEPKPVGAVAT